MTHILDHVSTTGKLVAETLALGTIGATLLKILPGIAAVFAIVWHGVLLYDWASKKIGNHRRKEDQKKNKVE